MYSFLISCHSLVRWFVLASLIYSIYRSYRGYVLQAVYSKTDDLVRHWTATIAHIQLVIGIMLYSQSPLIHYFLKNYSQAIHTIEFTFFGLIHIGFMVAAIILITIGSALGKRKQTDKEKFKTMLVWFSISLLIILISIPWPFSPLVNRPYFR